MENTNTIPSSEYSRNKRNVVIALILLYILTSPLELFFDARNPIYQILNFLVIVGGNVLVFAWCHIDSRERNQPLSANWRLIIMFFGVLALLIYLLKTRGFKQGLIAIGKTFLILLAILVGSVVVSTLVLLVKGNQVI